ncbi:speckle-type POZ protein-like [Aphidius gifuensis]|uniref:speckle-type POZ protein-like n=1 Tax=Aphidius gifuensis TaxID=684658 RepID=UPI001CDC538E|nr:speckle-type POZ protein-like [Aphidius gifuensis]
MLAIDDLDQTETNGTWKWKIKQFSQYKTQCQAIFSPTFGPNKSKDFFLIIFPNGDTESVKNYVGVFVCFVDKSVSKKITKNQLKFKFSLLTSDMKIKYEREDYYPAGTSTTSWGYPCFIKRSFLFNKSNAYLPNDCLTISCQIIQSLDPTIRQHKTIINIPDNHHEKILETMIKDKNVGDIVTIKIGDDKFRIYKSLLTSNSPVFTAMFEHKETKESIENIVELKDIHSVVCKIMLNFLHTNYLPSATISYFKNSLLQVADKYQLDKLKALCEEAFYEELKIDNAAETLMTADLYDAQQLKKATINFIICHLRQVITTNGYALIKQANPSLGCEVLETFITKISNIVYT